MAKPKNNKKRKPAETQAPVVPSPAPVIRTSADLLDFITDALASLGLDGSGLGGLKGWLQGFALDHPRIVFQAVNDLVGSKPAGPAIGVAVGIGATAREDFTARIFAIASRMPASGEPHGRPPELQSAVDGSAEPPV
jgi:hypothetical protein